MEAKSNPEATDAGRAKVGEWLAGCEAVRGGLFNAFFIELNDERDGIMVTPENVDEAEDRIRSSFEEVYPDLFPADPTVLQLEASHARRNSELYVYPDQHAHAPQGALR